jgi:hypothetical protein
MVRGMLFGVPVRNAPPHLTEEVEAAFLSQVSEVANEVCNGMLVTSVAVRQACRVKDQGGLDHRPSRNVSGSAVRDRGPPIGDFFSKKPKAICPEAARKGAADTGECRAPIADMERKLSELCFVREYRKSD